jgi:hypothetical protein
MILPIIRTLNQYKEWGVKYRVFFSCLNDKRPPDALLALRHMSSLGRFISR